jgi:gas vesicle protein
MEGDDRRNRLKTFLLGGLVGAAAAVLAAARRRESVAEALPRRGLSAFEDAPCFHEQAVRDESRPS